MSSSSPMLPVVVAHIVTFNHRDCIETCIRSLLDQEHFELHKNLFVFLTDNASSDGTADEVARLFIGEIKLHRNITNLGFTGAHNHGPRFVSECSADYLLILNPDVRLERNALSCMVRALEQDTRAGVCCPKLYRADDALQAVEPPRFDSTGMFITPAFRHFDRGSDEPDRGQYNRPEYVFGASGACALFRKSLLEDVLLETSDAKDGSDFFDNAFFAYREDADLAWRAQWLGWKCRYEPAAVGYHRRVVLPERRAQLPAELNAYGVKNRFLLQLNNFSLLANWQHLPFFLWRNLIVIAGVLLKERSSIPALTAALQLAPRAFGRRSILFKRRRNTPAAMGSWFSFIPKSFPALPVSSALPPSSKLAPLQSMTIAIIDFESGPRLVSCLRAVLETVKHLTRTISVSIVVVDNGEDSDFSAAEQLDEFREVLFERPAHNLGFAGAINHICTRYPAEAFLILNPDVQISAAAINSLIEAMDAHPAIGAIAPVLLGPDGKPQLPYLLRGFPTLGSTLAELFMLHRFFPRNPWTERHLPQQDQFLLRYLEQAIPEPSKPFEPRELPIIIGQPAAACLMVRQKAFQDIGGFDARFWPAWFEDVDFCKRLVEQGYLCGVLSKSSVAHEGGYSSKQLGKHRFSEIWYGNLLRYWRKHGTTGEYTLIRLLLPFALMLRSLAFYLVTKFSKHQTPAEREDNILIAKNLFRLAGTYVVPAETPEQV